LSIEMMLLLVLGALAVLGALVGVGIVLRQTAGSAAALEANSMVPRVSAEVRAGEEQVLIHLARSLALPSGRDEVGYGEIYIAGSAGMTMKLASRSEIGRGFDGEVRVHRAKRASIAEYYILRLPGDETVLADIAALDERLVTALRTIDPQAQVRRQGRGVDPGRPALA
jgi:hypothetical protein